MRPELTIFLVFISVAVITTALAAVWFSRRDAAV